MRGTPENGLHCRDFHCKGENGQGTLFLHIQDGFQA